MTRNNLVKYIYLFIFVLLSVQIAGAQPKKERVLPASKPSVQKTLMDTPAMRRTIKIKADEVARLLLAGEYAKMFELMHPKVRQMTGGKESFIKVVGDEVKRLEADGFKIISMENFEPEKIMTAGSDLFAVVPTKLKIQTPQGNLIQSAYDVAISADKGRTWFFVGGSNGKDSLEKLFPTITGKLTFPEPAPPVSEQ